VLAAGAENERRDRQVKLKLYSHQGVLEYWIADWRNQLIEIYQCADGILKLQRTLSAGDTLTSPLFPDFARPVAEIFQTQ